MTTEREAWLALTAEEPIDPDMPICDAHHHLWDRPNDRYLLEELLQDTEGGGHHVVQTVFVEAFTMYRQDGPKEMRPVGETEFVQGIAARNESRPDRMVSVAAGIVGFADLTLGTAVEPVLEAHIVAGKGRFRGIRQVCAWAPGPVVMKIDRPRGLMLDLKFREGFARLRKYNLSFDATVYHPQLMELVDLARAFPDITIIMDHVGIPVGVGLYAGKHEEVFQEWKRVIPALAACHNVLVKLGGLGLLTCGFGWDKQARPPGSVELARVMAPYYLWCIEHFGVDRCMFESDFPPDKRSYSYTVIWNTFKRITERFSPRKRASLFHDTAVKAYRL